MYLIPNLTLVFSYLRKINTCTSWNISIADEKLKLQKNYDNHINNKNVIRKLKDKDKKKFEEKF